jgi:hypothetical protein
LAVEEEAHEVASMLASSSPITLFCSADVSAADAPKPQSRQARNLANTSSSLIGSSGAPFIVQRSRSKVRPSFSRSRTRAGATAVGSMSLSETQSG